MHSSSCSTSSPLAGKGLSGNSVAKEFVPRFDGLRFIETLVTAHRWFQQEAAMVEQRVLGEKKEFCSVFVQFHFLKFSLSRVLMYVWLMMDGGFFISSSHEIIPEASSFSLMINYVLFIGFIFILIKNGYYMNRILSHFDCSRELSSRQWFIWFTEMGNSTILLA